MKLSLFITCELKNLISIFMTIDADGINIHNTKPSHYFYIIRHKSFNGRIRPRIQTDHGHAAAAHTHISELSGPQVAQVPSGFFMIN